MHFRDITATKEYPKFTAGEGQHPQTPSQLSHSKLFPSGRIFLLSNFKFPVDLRVG